MRRLLINLIGCSMAAFALLATACQPTPDDNSIAPNFPEKETAEVAAGEIYTITNEPNQDWTLTIPEEATFFTIFLLSLNKNLK